MTAVADKTTVSRRTRGRNAPSKKAVHQASLVPDHKQHKGIAVVSEIPVPSPLDNGSFFKSFCKLRLADGSDAWACNDCSSTFDTRGEIHTHRNGEHGGRFGKRRPKVEFPPDPAIGDLVLPPRKQGVPAPSNPMEWTLAEFMALVPSIGALGDLVARSESERDVAIKELNERAAHDKQHAAKLANYDSLMEELVERRMAMKGHGSYEELKNEVQELRRWKLMVTRRLAGVGFVLSEEEEK